MKVGAQLYTLRDFTQTREGFRETLHRLRDIGYDHVQLSAVACLETEVTADEARAMMDEVGITCGATHRPFAALRDQLDQEVEFHQKVGTTNTALGMPPDEVWKNGVRGYEEWLPGLEKVVKAARERGLEIAYHNHAFEFAKEGGRRPIDLLLAADWLPMEIDTYWVHVAGGDLAEILGELKGRVPFVHFKDVAPDPWQPTMAALGEGNLNWERLLGLFEEAGTEWIFVEQDTCPRDPFDCLLVSRETLRALGV